jgi:hypothetical protein
MVDLSRPGDYSDRYRLYLDESGDHVFRETDQLSHRFLCLLGCWFQNPAYLKFHADLEALKNGFLPNHPDDPVILHREEMVNQRNAFSTFRNEMIREAFNRELLEVIDHSDFNMVAVIIDKQVLREKYGEGCAHPYHLGLGFLMQRYAGYLNRINRVGDIMAEARGGKEDQLLQDSYTRAYERGIWGVTSSNFFQSALTSSSIKFRSKKANIAGLQLSDILCHPVKMWVLKKFDLTTDALSPFGSEIIGVVEDKFNHHLYKGTVEGYGYLVYPQK